MHAMIPGWRRPPHESVILSRGSASWRERGPIITRDRSSRGHIRAAPRSPGVPRGAAVIFSISVLLRYTQPRGRAG